MHRIKFEDFGVKPIIVNEGATFHLSTVRPVGSGSFGYVESAHASEYHNIDGQENIFWTVDSRHNTHGTTKNRGMFPGVLYCGGVVNESIGQPEADNGEDY